MARVKLSATMIVASSRLPSVNPVYAILIEEQGTTTASKSPSASFALMGTKIPVSFIRPYIKSGETTSPIVTAIKSCFQSFAA